MSQEKINFSLTKSEALSMTLKFTAQYIASNV